MSFVVKGREDLYAEDFQEVLGPACEEEANEAFAALDQDGNGNIKLDEMVIKVVEIGRNKEDYLGQHGGCRASYRRLGPVFLIVLLIITLFIFGM